MRAVTWCVVALAALGCDGGGAGPGGDTGEGGCARPDGYPGSAGYLGALGDHGCEADQHCVIEPGEDAGDCLAGADLSAGVPCVVTGKAGAAVGWSQHCDPQDPAAGSCVVADGDWLGTCSPFDAGAAVSGVIPACEAGAPEVAERFSVRRGEVLRFDVAWTPDPTDPAGVNVRANFQTPEGEYLGYAGNDLEVGGAVLYGEAGSGALAHGFGFAGDRDWWFRRDFGCAEVAFEGAFERLSPPIAHVDLASAAPLASGVEVTAHSVCSEVISDATEANEQYFAISVESGSVALSLSKEAFSDLTNVSDGLTVTILDATGSPVIVSGNPASVYLGTGSSESIPYDLEAGDYYLEVSQDASCGLSRYTLSY